MLYLSNTFYKNVYIKQGKILFQNICPLFSSKNTVIFITVSFYQTSESFQKIYELPLFSPF